MSVLNQSGEEQVECPLCMEPLEVDDLNFFPCTCGYQICRFCWHRIRTDENGLCPACRKAYSENPADFIPLSKEQVAQLKAEKRQRDQQRKAKLSESRKHLASVRVVQRNLVFVVGLPMRLADPEVLKKYEYFGKFGKIHKVVINQSTSYAGTQGPSASAYVTYMKSDDALRAIQHVNNTIMDGKTIKTSLGTTKYCSHFMKNQPCPKPDCMYLHDFGDQEASFTKEQMHAGKHQEYEKKLHEALLSKLAAQSQQSNANGSIVQPTVGTSSAASTSATVTPVTACVARETTPTDKSAVKSKEKDSTSGDVKQNTNKENWPQLNAEKGNDKKPDKAEKDKKGKRKVAGVGERKTEKRTPPPPAITPEREPEIKEIPIPVIEEKIEIVPLENSVKLNPILDDNSSFFSQSSFAKISLNSEQERETPTLLPQAEALLEINTDNWDLNFGFTKHSNHLEELAKQRINVKDTLETFGNNYLEPFKMDGSQTFGQLDYNTENLLETLAKNSVNYTQNIQTNGHYVPNGHKDMLSGGNINGLDHMSKLFNDLYKNGYSVPTQQPLSPNIHITDNLSRLNGAFSHNLNGFHQIHPQQQQQQQQQQQHMSPDKHNYALLQRQREIEEQLMNLNLASSKHTGFGQYEMGGGGGAGGGGGGIINGAHHHTSLQNGINPFGLTNANIGPQQQTATLFGNSAISSSSATNATSNSAIHQNARPILEDKELDFGFQEAQKALEELVESDSHMHNTARTIGSSQINGLVHSQSGNHLNHLPPPPPGFVQQTNTHMNSFGSKILPYLNMNSQQQQMNTTQNNWPSSFNQMQQQQQQQQNQHKDPAILTSRRHIPNMPPLLDQYGPLSQTQQQQQQQPLGTNGGGVVAPPPPPPQTQQQQQQQQQQQMTPGGGLPPRGAPSSSSVVGGTYDAYNGAFSNFSPLQQNYNNYSHLTAQQNLNWLGNEINTQISSPPGFRTSGQATKQQEC